MTLDSKQFRLLKLFFKPCVIMLPKPHLLNGQFQGANIYGRRDKPVYFRGTLLKN